MSVLSSSVQPEIMTFRLEGQLFGIDAGHVTEIVRAVSIAALPGAPWYVEGMIDVRGALMPVIDMRARFGIATRPLQQSDHLILATTRGQPLALRVDCVEDLTASGEAVLETVGSPHTEMAQTLGIMRMADGLLVVWDLDAFLSEGEAEALLRALEAIRENQGGASS